jgi:hypothetical protein
MHTFIKVTTMNRYFTGFEFEAQKCERCGFLMYGNAAGLGEHGGFYVPDCDEYLAESVQDS